jgi:hypothetical protein
MSYNIPHGIYRGTAFSVLLQECYHKETDIHDTNSESSNR